MLRSLDIRSKIILALFAVSAIAVLVTAVIGYRSGREALASRIAAQLTSLTATTAQQTEAYFRNQTGQAAALSRDLMIIEATRDFAEAVDALPAEPRPDALAGLVARYREGFLPRLPGAEGTEPVVEAYLPQTPRGVALQHAYVLREGGGDLVAPRPYAAAHRRYHEAMTAIVRDGGYEDIFLISPDGFVLYTVLKETDFATSLLRGPYADTGLARAFRAARRSRTRGEVHLEDYSFYAPSLGVPAAFVSVPLFDGGDFVGVLALQLSDAEIDAIANQGGDWAAAGLGDGGEVFLVGADTRLRTIPRAYIEDAQDFVATARARGEEAGTIAMIEANGSPVLLQSANSPAVMDAVAGRSGVQRIPADYAGVPALSASAPLGVPGLDWVVVAEMPLSEAFAPIRTFQRRLVIAGAGLTVGLTVLAMLLASAFMRPVKTLMTRVKAVADGELDTPVRLDRTDELGELSAEVQVLVDSLKYRSATAGRALHRAEGVLERFLPEGAVRALKRQIEDDAKEDDAYELIEEVPALSVVVLHLHGHEEALRARSPQDGVALLDRLVEEIAQIGERHGVEEVRFTSDRYVAAAGLSVPLLDHERRAVAFARDAIAAVHRVAKAEDLAIEATAGVASGADVLGVVGTRRLSFGLWGTTAAAAKSQAANAAAGEVAMTAAVRDALNEATPAPAAAAAPVAE